MADENPSFEDIAGFLQLASFSELKIQKLANSHAPVIQQLRKLDPLETAVTFGALLACPDLKCNGTRLEVLAHLALAFGQKARKPSAKEVAKCFNSVGKGLCGRMEDPAEDVFVGLIRSPRGSFRVIEGVWESATFYLQRVVNVMEGMPRGNGYDDLRNSIYALLRLSELVCARANTDRYISGGEMPAKKIPIAVLNDLASLRGLVRFTEEELIASGIDIESLAAFIFNSEARAELAAESIGHTKLERFPVLHRNGDFFLVLPTAVSLAIRRYLVESMDAYGMRPAMLAGLAREYGALFRSIAIMGGPLGVDIEFRRTGNGYFAGISSEIDNGRHLHLLFAMENLSGFEVDSFAGFSAGLSASADDLDQFIDHAINISKAAPGFLQGTTLIVGCGLGRAVTQALNNKERQNWRIETISAPDLYTLSWVPNFKPITLWRILDARDKLESQGVQLQNINGLLNLVAWVRSLEGHLVPHGSLPDEFLTEGGNNFILIEQNGILALRQEVLRVWDPHMQLDVQGLWANVRREGVSLFEEDAASPLYAREGAPAGVYVTSKRSWWCEIEEIQNTGGSIAYQRWKTAAVWLSRAAPVLEKAFADLSAGPMLWRMIYEGVPPDAADGPALEYDSARAELSYVVDRTTRELIVRATPAFDHAHRHVDNIAERALVAALVEATGEFARVSLSALAREQLVDEIVPGPLARQQHAFSNPTYRDYVRSSLPKRPIVIDEIDDATSRLGLGWEARNREEGLWIRGKTEATEYLNRLVRVLEDKLVASLRHFDRRAMIEMILRNHEAAAIDREHWRRTAAANVALHEDKASVRDVIARREFKLSAVSQTSRVLVEFAVCECPLTGGRKPGILDLSQLMTIASEIFNIGGWSDAVRWGLMEPRLRVTPLGDVHANLQFIDSIVEPFSLAAADSRLDEAIKSYPKNVERLDPSASGPEELEPEFAAAFEEQLGASFKQLRTFVEFVEDLGIRADRALLMLPRSSLLRPETEIGEVSEELAIRIVENLSLKTRPEWRTTPQNYDDRDRDPWRFRRRLTVLRKPLIQIDDLADPTIMVAPAMLREAFVYMTANYHAGNFPSYQLSPAMRLWAGRTADRRGSRFAADVAERLEALGWRTEVEVKITKLLGQGFARDYGDVDVLAWKPLSERVLIIECKDVQFRKTYGEVAEQLSEFRGETRPNGKPDYLMLHLNRMELIRSNFPAVAKYVKLAMPSIESHLVFRNPVPMSFALDRLRERVAVHVYGSLANI